MSALQRGRRSFHWCLSKATITFLLLAVVLSAFLLPAVPSGHGRDASCRGVVNGLSKRYDPSAGSGFLAMRAGPTSQATQVGELFNGDGVEIINSKGNWLLVIDADGDFGWVYRRFVSYRCEGNERQQPPGGNVQAKSCYDLWYERNAIMNANGYCFESRLGQETFDNTDCWTSNIKLSPSEKRRVTSIRNEERRRGCKVNSDNLRSAEPLPRPPPPPIVKEKPLPTESYTTTGSGFTVSDDGLVLTNRHVVKECKTITVHDRGSAVVKGLDDSNDLALLKFDGETRAMPFRSTSPGLGDTVFALGFPYAGVLGAGVNFTGGLISSLSGIGNDSRYLQFTAPIQPGNSGGPLVDAEGLVVGVVTSRLADIEMLQASGSLPQNVNFAVRGELTKAFLRANGVDPMVGQSKSPLSSSEIAKKAQAYTVQIICHSGHGN